MTMIPENIADLSIKLLETWTINVVAHILNMKVGDVLGTDDIMKMSLKSLIFIVIYR